MSAVDHLAAAVDRLTFQVFAQRESLIEMSEAFAREEREQLAIAHDDNLALAYEIEHGGPE